MPEKLHPLWYSEYIPLWFFMSAIVGGLAMTIIESMASHRIFAHQIKNHDPEHLDRVTLGLGKATSVTLFAYFFMKVIGLAHGNNWHYLDTGYGYWYLVEVIGFVLIPAMALMYAVQNNRVRMVRGWAIVAVIGIILNRVNHSIIAFNWHLPWAGQVRAPLDGGCPHRNGRHHRYPHLSVDHEPDAHPLRSPGLRTRKALSGLERRPSCPRKSSSLMTNRTW